MPLSPSSVVQFGAGGRMGPLVVWLKDQGRSGTIGVWDGESMTSTWPEVHYGSRGNEVIALAVSGDGTFVGAALVCAEGVRVVVWRIDGRGTPLDISGVDTEVNGMALSEGGEAVAIKSKSGVQLWLRRDTGFIRVEGSWEGIQGGIATAIAVTSSATDGASDVRLLVGFQDGTVKTWERREGRRIAHRLVVLPANTQGPCLAVSVTPEGQEAATLHPTGATLFGIQGPGSLDPHGQLTATGSDRLIICGTHSHIITSNGGIRAFARDGVGIDAME